MTPLAGGTGQVPLPADGTYQLMATSEEWSRLESDRTSRTIGLGQKEH